MSIAKTASHARRSETVRATDIYSKDYLDWYYTSLDVGYINDPRNAFNADQAAQAFATFSSLASGDAPHMLAEYGLRPLRTSLARDSVVVKWLNPQGTARLRADHPSLEVVPALRLQPQWVQSMLLDVGTTVEMLNTHGADPLKIQVVDPAGQPVVDAKVILVYDVARKAGVEVVTGADGTVTVVTPRNRPVLDSFAVIPRHSYWTHGVKAWPVPSATALVQLRSLDGAHHTQFPYLPPSLATDGLGVKVAVIDGGVGPHPALVVTGGENLVLPGQEDQAERDSFQDNGLGHGTHVAGIIAARDIGNGGPLGIAPAATLFSYRVFAKGKRDGDDMAIAEAIDAAAEDGCDLLNLSLGFSAESRLISRALRRAFAKGCVAIAAVGNGGRQSVYYPAAMSGVIGVTALGGKSRLPADTISALTLQRPPSGTRDDDFVGAFCNIGPGVTLAAPGVGIVSCAPGGFYAVEDGTSMATPVITGYAARVLSRDAALLALPRNQDRADAIRAKILHSCDQLGFPIEYVGNGHPLP